MSRYLIDTSVLSRYFERDAADRHPMLVAKVRAAFDAERPHVSVVTSYELLRGVQKLVLEDRGQRKLEQIRRFVDDVEPVEIEWGVAVDLWARSQQRGALLGELDLLIVASAVGAGRVLATADDTLVEALVALHLERHVEWWPSRA